MTDLCGVWYRAGSCILPTRHDGLHQTQEQREHEAAVQELRDQRDLLEKTLTSALRTLENVHPRLEAVGRVCFEMRDALATIQEDESPLIDNRIGPNFGSPVTDNYVGPEEGRPTLPRCHECGNAIFPYEPMASSDDGDWHADCANAPIRGRFDG